MRPLLNYYQSNKHKTRLKKCKKYINYYIYSTLTKTVANKEYEVEKAYVLSNYNVKTEGEIVYLPVYMTMFIGDDAALPVLEEI